MTREYVRVRDEINGIVENLVESGIVDDQNFAYIERTSGSKVLVRHSHSLALGSILRLSRYEDQYWQLREGRAFNLLMLDGALIQMSYEFISERLIRHRLAFLPSPRLLDYQSYPEIYTEEMLYTDVVEKGAVSVPLRFDYDARTGVPVVLKHPTSHLTLGQYLGCRIPVTAGLTPHAFVEFLLTSFYGTVTQGFAVELPSPKLRFRRCIDATELQVVHIGVPTYL